MVFVIPQKLLEIELWTDFVMNFFIEDDNISKSSNMQFAGWAPKILASFDQNNVTFL